MPCIIAACAVPHNCLKWYITAAQGEALAFSSGEERHFCIALYKPHTGGEAERKNGPSCSMKRKQTSSLGSAHRLMHRSRWAAGPRFHTSVVCKSISPFFQPCDYLVPPLFQPTFRPQQCLLFPSQRLICFQIYFANMQRT